LLFADSAIAASVIATTSIGFDIPVVQKAHGHRILVFVVYFTVLDGVRVAFPSVRT